MELQHVLTIPINLKNKRNNLNKFIKKVVIFYSFEPEANSTQVLYYS